MPQRSRRADIGLLAATSFRRCALAALALTVPLLAQQPWSPATSPASQTLWGIAHGNNRFVAVGEAGTILTSPDGLAWTARASGTDKWLLGVTFSPTLDTFVVVGDAGTILTSPDGITWTPRTSGTAQRLNSVAWSPKRFTFPDVFLTVGENGTALTSHDLVTWTPRPTGDTGWLRGIATAPPGGADFFVVTGHDGTILTTNDAGETFQRRVSGTTLHLDAVASFENAFYATGSNFALSRSTDGLTWTLDRTVNTDGRENGIVYNGLVAFNRALVVVGDQGRIIDEAGRAWRTTEPLLAGWRAVAASRDRVVAVGTGGSIATAPLDPNLALEHDLAATFLADTIVLNATQRRPISGSFTRQWHLDGQPIPGATQSTLRLNTLTAAQNGIYTFTTTSPSGATSSASLTLDPQPNPASLNLVDLTFRPNLSAPPVAIAPLADSRLYVAGQDATLLRLNADGSIDSTFAIPAGTLTGSPRALVVQSDNRLVVFERLTANPVTYRAIRFTSTGAIDATFRPHPALIADGDTPILLADGRWLAVERRPLAAPTPQLNFTAVLRRFNSDGTLDSTFPPAELLRGSTVSTDPVQSSFFSGPRALATRDAQNRVYLGVQHGDFAAASLGATSGTTRLFRLQPDGTADPTFSPRDVGPLFTLVTTSQGLLARTVDASFARLQGTATTTSLFRLHFDGSLDSTFVPHTLRTHVNSSVSPPTGLGNDYNVLTVAPDGSVIARTTGHHGHFGLVRFDASGEFDRNFNAELGSDAATLTQVHALPQGQLLVGGTFRSLLGVAQPFLARLTPNIRAAATHLSNVSVRDRAGTGSNTLIAGYATRGGETTVLARGAGPALTRFGVTNPLADPVLSLYLNSTPLSSNDDWHSGPADILAATAARLGAFPFEAGSTDAALYAPTSATPLTLQVTGKNGTTGIALAEIYLASAPPADASAARIVNLSVRSLAGTGPDTLIVGFTLAGTATRNIVLRAIGPGLARFGVTDSLPDPVLTLYRETTAIATNDDWAPSQEIRLTLTEAFNTVGAFPLETAISAGSIAASKDSALLISLAPGSYTAHVTGKSDATGIALIEIYEVP